MKCQSLTGESYEAPKRKEPRNHQKDLESRTHHNMPSDKRRTAIANFTSSISFHEKQIPICFATRVDMHRSKIVNLRKMIDNTSAKL